MSQSISYTRRSDEFAKDELQQILHTFEFMQIEFLSVPTCADKFCSGVERFVLVSSEDEKLLPEAKLAPFTDVGVWLGMFEYF